MYDLPTLSRLNANADRNLCSETETTRHCSYTGNPDKGIVLHSAKKRSTAFLSPGPRSETFLTLRRVCRSPESLDRLVESYFS